MLRLISAGTWRGRGDTALLDEGQRLRQMCKTVCIRSGTEYWARQSQVEMESMRTASPVTMALGRLSRMHGDQA